MWIGKLNLKYSHCRSWRDDSVLELACGNEESWRVSRSEQVSWPMAQREQEAWCYGVSQPPLHRCCFTDWHLAVSHCSQLTWTKAFNAAAKNQQVFHQAGSLFHCFPLWTRPPWLSLRHTCDPSHHCSEPWRGQSPVWEPLAEESWSCTFCPALLELPVMWVTPAGETQTSDVQSWQGSKRANHWKQTAHFHFVSLKYNGGKLAQHDVSGKYGVD